LAPAALVGGTGGLWWLAPATSVGGTGVPGGAAVCLSGVGRDGESSDPSS
jgi:hypothetical protein